MGVSRRDWWNERYGSVDLVWGSGPNRFLEAELGEVAPRGRALDLACGEGRNAMWLAERGWEVTAVDFSEVAIERARKLERERGVRVEWVCDDVVRYEPAAGAFALVVILYLQVPGSDWRDALRHAADALAPGGELLLIGHARRNLLDGVGGPQDAAVLWEPDEIARELGGLGLEVERAVEIDRATDAGVAIDALIRAHQAPRARRP